MNLLVLTISDRASRGEYEDLSGPAIEALLRERIPEAEVSRLVVSDDPGRIEKALLDNLAHDIILTTGGTGVGPRDNTPDVTTRICDRLVPGLAETMRAESLKQTPQAMLSRAVVGVRGTTLIVNLPGSLRGAKFCAEVVIPALPHATKMIAGGGHENH